LNLTNSTVSGNSANGTGGIKNEGTLNLTSVTVTKNQSTNQFCPSCSGGVENLGTANLKNTIVAGNTNGNANASPDFRNGVAAGSAYNLIGNGTGMSGIANNDANHNQVNVDAKLAPLANNGGVTQTHALLPSSPAIDKGNSFTLTTDQRGAGFNRPVNLPDSTYPNATGGNGADIGAFEAQTAPLPPPDLSVTKTHTGSFTRGDTGKTYSIIVTNIGGIATSGIVSVTDTLPAGLTATAMTGIGWTCNLQPLPQLPPLTCTRSDALAIGASYPAITLTVSVAANAPDTVTNIANVSGGGESNTANNTASDPTSVEGATQTVTRSDDRNNSTCTAGDCSLREAINQANASPDVNTIQFSALFDSEQTITLTNGQLFISTSMTILGKGANLITISGNNVTRVFSIAQNPLNVTISGLTIANGNGSDGGGIRNLSTGTVNLTNCAFTSNSSATGYGGGLEDFSPPGGGALNITGCTFSGNTATEGGAIKIQSNTVNIINTTISGNTSSNGGIANYEGALTITNSTITGNTSSGTGGVVGISASGTTTVKNSIIAGNNGANPDVGGSFISSGYNFIGKSDGSSGFADGGGEQVGTIAAPKDPLLSALGNNGGTTQTHALSLGSPALDKGSGTGTDQRGLARPVDLATYTNAAGGNGADIGAFEAQAAPVASSSISGAIKYGITAANQPDQYVAGVLLSATGTTSTSANSSGATGAYTLNGLTSGGTYTVTPSKTGEIKGINSLDATRIQQHRVGLITLTQNQLIAADTDGSGAVNSLDATRIQQRAVGIIAQNIIGQWKFVPSSKQYNSINSNLSAENYEAVLVGEVSGNWATAASFAGDSETEEEILPKQDVQSDSIGRFEDELSQQIAELMKQSANSQSNDSKSESAIAGGVAVNVSLPTNASVSTGSSITIPVTVGAVSAGTPIESFDFTVFYDPAVLQPANPSGSNTGTLSANCSVLANSPTAGRIVVSGACATAITTASGGVLYNLQFNVIGSSGQQTGLLFNNPSTGIQTFQFNSGTPAANTTNGLFSVLGPTSANISVSGRVITASGRGIRNVQITLIDAQGNQRTATSTTFGYYRFDNVAAGETVTLSVKARQFRFNQPTIVRTTNESVSNADFVSQQ
jgi:hypothetical protein